MLIESEILIESINIHIFIFNRVPRFVAKHFSVYELNEFNFDEWEGRENEKNDKNKRKYIWIWIASEIVYTFCYEK